MGIIQIPTMDSVKQRLGFIEPEFHINSIDRTEAKTESIKLHFVRGITGHCSQFN